MLSGTLFEMKASSVRVITANKSNEAIINKLLSSSNFSSTFELIAAENLENSTSKSANNLIFIDSMNDFRTISGRLNSQKFNLNGNFVLFAENCSNIDAEEVFNAAWKRHIVNINIICYDNGSTSVKTFTPYQHGTCGNTSSITVNKSDKFFPKKLKNLFGCPIKLVTFFYPPITMRDTLANGTFKYFGSEMDLAFGLADALNFSLDIAYISQLGFPGILYENGTATGILNQTITGEKDMLIGFYYLTYLRSQHMSFTQSHYSIPLIIMIPNGEPLTAFEKLFRPFQNVVWIFLGITFGSGVLVIAIINCQQKKVRDFIVGKGIQTPYLNMIIVFVGGSQHALPKRNFARSLLMIFTLFCLVQRSIYQSSLFLFIQSDGRHPEVATIDEMIDKKFDFYIRETLEHNIKHMQFYNR